MRLKNVKEQACEGYLNSMPCDLGGYLEQQRDGATIDYTVWPLEQLASDTWVTWVAERFSGRGWRSRMRLCKEHRRLMYENFEDIARIEVEVSEATDDYYNRNQKLVTWH